MANDLTERDLANYGIDVTTAEGTHKRVIRAAYLATEPGWLLLKDHEHRTVAQYSAHIVIGAERLSDR